jgi:hypothetical protein
MNNYMVKRLDGKFEEALGEHWLAEYAEDPTSGLWDVHVFRHDVAMWHGTAYASLEDARLVARNYYIQA